MLAEKEKKKARAVKASGTAPRATAAAPIAGTRVPSTITPRMVGMTVNGRPYSLHVEPNWTLRDILRQKLGFTSVKDFCNGYGACGSCTVIMDGRPILSCLMLASECDGATIETAEGVAENRPDLVETYVMNHCMQCGYCTPGFIVTAKALMDRIPNPTEEDIREALGGNICRCGTYPQHILAVQEATAKKTA